MHLLLHRYPAAAQLSGDVKTSPLAAHFVHLKALHTHLRYLPGGEKAVRKITSSGPESKAIHNHVKSTVGLKWKRVM